MFITYLFMFILGAVMGSFYNVVAYRIIKKDYKGILIDRSSCPNCKTQLKMKDLVPLFSYIFLGGKCRYCGNKIPLVYFIFELITGTSFVIVYKLYTNNWQLALIFVSIVLIIGNIIYRKTK